MSRAFHLMSKPTSYHCNLSCDYCFYLDNPTVNKTGESTRIRMTDEVLEAYIRKYISTSADREINFTWQGGEPTLAGREFFQRALDLQQRYANGKQITNSLQTNGILLDDEWASFLAKNQFLVGVSLDGPKHLHDHFRKGRHGDSRFEQTMSAVKRLQDCGADYNILTTVNAKNVQSALEVYHFLTADLGAKFLQFIPIVERSPCTPEHLAPWSVGAVDYGNFMTTIFDQWVRHDVGSVFVQLFDSLLGCWLNVSPALCTLQPECGYAWVIEQNGDIFLCDHFVTPEHRLGNVMHDQLADLLEKPQAAAFGAQKAVLAGKCQSCDYRFACHGGCPKQRIIQQGGVPHNILCEGFLHLFRHMDPYLRYMSHCVQNRMSPALVMQAAEAISARQR